MYQKKYHTNKPVALEYGLKLFGKKWNARLVCLLSDNGVMRFSEIRKQLEPITDTVLSGKLAELIKSGIIDRVTYNEIPPRVEYTLTEKGKAVVPVLLQLRDWSAEYDN